MMETEIATMSEPSEPVMEPGPELTLSDREAELILTYTEAGASPEGIEFMLDELYYEAEEREFEQFDLNEPDEPPAPWELDDS